MSGLMPLLLCFVAQGGEKEAEQLYRAMELKLTSAKALKFVCKASMEGGPQGIQADVTGYVTQDNRVHVKVSGSPRGKKEEILIISDGKKHAVKHETGEPTVRDAPAKVANSFLRLLSRATIGVAVDELTVPGSQPSPDEIRLSGFKLGVKEKVDGKRVAQVVEYDIAVQKVTFKVKLWIDTKTQLPVHRVLVLAADGKEVRFIDAFSEFAEDPPLDAKMFEVPKGK